MECYAALKMTVQKCLLIRKADQNVLWGKTGYETM